MVCVTGTRLRLPRRDFVPLPAIAFWSFVWFFVKYCVRWSFCQMSVERGMSSHLSSLTWCFLMKLNLTAEPDAADGLIWPCYSLKTPPVAEPCDSIDFSRRR